ncbi:HpcH/HpaI aldolase family protein [Aureimonas mangrovi]|uniref:HpcH/HpaI aldolase family protein n=1 Tax=Aureimonas mangrovi TaxID=2758041 RepID=UPI00163DAA0E|nr:aldolase/citrate lyase family protein [Aureimonas mangrovi]
MPIPSLRGGGFRLSAWSSLPDTGVLESLMAASFDAIVLDMQHGMHDVRSMEAGITIAARAGKPAIVRVPVGDLAFVSRALDFGAAAVILPMIETVEDARAFVDVAKYPPLGNRSFGPSRTVALHGYGIGADYMRAANDSTLTLAMIETQSAYRDLDAILAVEGIDGVLVGPADLSVALLGRLDPNCAETIELTAHIAHRVAAAGKFASIYASDAEAAHRAKAQGFHLAGISSDMAMLKSAADSLAGSVER